MKEYKIGEQYIISRTPACQERLRRSNVPPSYSGSVCLVKSSRTDENEHIPCVMFDGHMFYIPHECLDTYLSQGEIEMRLKALQNEDPEHAQEAHREADGLLCTFLVQLGYSKMVEEWKKVAHP